MVKLDAALKQHLQVAEGTIGVGLVRGISGKPSYQSHCSPFCEQGLLAMDFPGEVVEGKGAPSTGPVTPVSVNESGS